VRDADADDSCFAPGGLRGDGFSQRGAAGIGVAKSDNVVARAGAAREKNRCFVCFRAGTGEKTLL